MAELKGLVLSLSEIHTLTARDADRREPHHRAASRRAQLHHMTYAVIDMRART